MNSKHFLAYEIYNEQLLRLIMTGKGDSKEADDIRDQMDTHWYRMSEEEQDEMRKQNEKAMGT
jgi:hypothetical protein